VDANRLREAFTAFFAARDHTVAPSASLVPGDPSVLFTIAGMVPFKPYFVGERPPPYPRATSVQKCFRTADIDRVGATTRHNTFFEMLGNFSFGDYFKEAAIPYAWELVTETLGLDPERLWVTVHYSDDEAAAIWRDAAGIPDARVQRMGEDNFWRMGDIGPCGPCAEIYYDKGPGFGEEGGPARGGPERYVEIWNLVFMQFNRLADGTLEDLPRKNIDTGAGLERLLCILQGVPSIFDTDVLRPLIEAAERATGRPYGDDDGVDVSLRIMAEHGRAVTFLVSDGVFPSNEDRGYVLRRIIRRAVRHAYRLDVDRLVTPSLVEATVEVMGRAYPDLARNRELVSGVVAREEERFRETLRSGSAILEEELARVEAQRARLEGVLAFRLHDTFGFPLELTREIAGERGVEVDVAGFEAAMEEQRRRGREARRAVVGGGDPGESHREVLEQFGPTEFTGYAERESKARVLGVVDAGGGEVEIFLDRTPFYAESGGQVGDTGEIVTDRGRAAVLDTVAPLPGLHAHRARVVEGTIAAGEEARVSIDSDRRERIRRNHTGTHLLHAALREVLGPHVKQHGSLVAPDRLRFDFSHYGAVSPEELARVEDLVNAQVLADSPVRAYETSREEAERLGAIAFFEEKYGDVVRVVEAGDRSLELCGGTHVSALGMIGPIKVVSESSIGANLRRIEALTGTGSFEHIRHEEELLSRSAGLLRAAPEEVPERIARTLGDLRELANQLRSARRQASAGEAQSLARQAVDGVVVARRDGTSRDELKELVTAVRHEPGVRVVVLGGVPEGGGVALVAATAPGSGLSAPELITDAARMVGGGGGGRDPQFAMAGGREAGRLDEALAAVEARARAADAAREG
jgi:alanyl-tRNA synthetase